MRNRSKRYRAASKSIEKGKEYSIHDAIGLLKETTSTKFAETVDVAVNLGVDPKQADQAIRGTVLLPHGNGKAVRVLVLTKTKEKEAAESGADFVGFDEYLQKIRDGWTDIDVIVATPESMVELGKLGKILGPKGLMPNPKSGTVTTDVAKAIREVKAGRVEFRVDKQGIVHCGIGKATFEAGQLEDNFRSFLSIIMRLKPSSAKGIYLKSVYVSTSMGPSVRVSGQEVSALTAHG